MNRTNTLYSRLDRAQRWSLATGLIASALCVVGLFLSEEQFFHAYLVAYLFWIGVALGCFAVLMFHHLMGAGWGYIIRRPLESGAMTIPLMALLFLPLLLGLGELYVWAQPEAVAADPRLQAKSAYLNVPFFLLRAFLYFTIWIVLTYRLTRRSSEQEQTDDPAVLMRLRRLSLGGLLLYVVTVTFASIDWAMSLDPHWYSSIYGVIFIIRQVLVALAFALAVLRFLVDYEPLASTITQKHVTDLGNLLLLFILLSAYTSYFQYLVIWAGNFPVEASWYFHRTQGGWQWLALLLIIIHFVVPFLLLLIRGARKRVPMLAAAGVLILFMWLVDIYWFVGPGPATVQFRLHWLDLATIVGIGGLWLALFLRHLKGTSLLPPHDPYIEEAIVNE